MNMYFPLPDFNAWVPHTTQTCTVCSTMLFTRSFNVASALIRLTEILSCVYITSAVGVDGSRLIIFCKEVHHVTSDSLDTFSRLTVPKDQLQQKQLPV